MSRVRVRIGTQAELQEAARHRITLRHTETGDLHALCTYAISSHTRSALRCRLRLVYDVADVLLHGSHLPPLGRAVGKGPPPAGAG